MWANAQRDVMVALPNIGGASVQRRKVWLTPTNKVPCSNAAKTPYQSWTWVHFARSNPTQSSNLLTQSNPIHDNSVYSDPHPIQSTIETVGKITKNWIMVARWLKTNKMLSNTDIKRPLKYVTQVFELTTSNIKYVTVRHDSIFTKPAWSLYNKNIIHSPQSNPIQSNPSFSNIRPNPIQSMDASNPCPTLRDTR